MPKSYPQINNKKLFSFSFFSNFLTFKFLLFTSIKSKFTYFGYAFVTKFRITLKEFSDHRKKVAELYSLEKILKRVF